LTAKLPPIEATQDSEQWVAARRGRLTASRMNDAMTFLAKGGSSVKRTDYMMELVAERMTGIAAAHYVTPAMQWGRDNEAPAIRLYEEKYGDFVRPAGLVLHPTIENFAASPDGFIISGELLIPVEVKCPTTKTFIEWRLSGAVPEEYRRQMIAQMACCSHHDKIRMGVFIAYDPRVTIGRNMMMIPVTVEDGEVEEVEQAAIRFLEQTDELFRKVVEA
jgi:putative phage-type endonuclease